MVAIVHSSPGEGGAVREKVEKDSATSTNDHSLYNFWLGFSYNVIKVLFFHERPFMNINFTNRNS